MSDQSQAVGRSSQRDPNHTPAVRQRVVWESGHGAIFKTLDEALRNAALHLIYAAWCRRRNSGMVPKPWSEWSATHWPESRIGQLSTWLRLRDEKAGWL